MKPRNRLATLNPLRGLTLDRLVVLMEQGEQGYYTDLQWLYRYIEKRNATVRGVRRKLVGALGKLDWDIKVRSDLPETRLAEAERQKAVLRAAYEKIGNLKKALTHLALAELRGFAHCEKVYAPDWTVRELRIVPQEYLVREGLGAPWEYNRELKSTNRGEPITRGHWIIREADDPADEIFAISHVKMEVSDADWDQFCDTYAVPPLFIEQPPNVPKGRETEYQNIAEAIVSDGRGSLPSGAKVHTVTPGTDSAVFAERLKYYQGEIVLAGTGGVLTMLTAPTGLGKGPAEEHDGTWLDIAASVAMNVSEAMQEQFDLPLLRTAFGEDVETLAYFEYAKPSEEDTAAHITNAKTLGEAGYEIELAELSEKTGYTIVKKEAAAPAGGNDQGPMTNNQSPESAPSVSPTRAGDAPADDAAPAVVPASAPETPPLPVSSSPSLPVLPPEPVRAATNPRPSQSATAKPSLIQSALAESSGVDAKTFAPIKPLLDAIERLLTSNAAPEIIIDQIEATIAALPDILTQLDIEPLVTALEAAAGPGAVQGVRDALAARAK